jgi:uncharacterized protein (DUF2062 family)
MRLRLLRLSASPYSVAAGAAVGVASAWTPFLGVHLIIALAIAFVIRANLVAAALGTTFANPLTFPFIWASTWEIGRVILGHEKAGPGDHVDLMALFSKLDFWQLWRPVLQPMTVGAVVPGVLSAVVCYAVVHTVVSGFQRRKYQKLLERVANKNISGLRVPE